MAGMFESYSYAQLFFLFNTAVFAVMFLYSLLTGTYMDVKQQMHGIPDQMGWFQFRKRYVSSSGDDVVLLCNIAVEFHHYDNFDVNMSI